jgi:capsular polysaccharide biosynthesis protein
MESRQQGEQMTLMYPAGLPLDPSFPNRLFCAAAGLGAGLAVGLALAVWMELRDKSLKDERDVEATLQMPVLVSIPWVLEEPRNGSGFRYGGGRNGGSGARDRDKVHA